MNVPDWLVVTAAAGVALTLLATASQFVLPDHRRRGPLLVLLSATVVVGLASTALAWTARPAPPLAPGSVTLASPDDGGRVGCVTDVGGLAGLPVGRGLLLVLEGADGVSYLQGGRAVVQGPMDGRWSFPGMRVADQFYPEARYRLRVLVVESAAADRARDAVAGDSDRGWPLRPDDVPSAGEVSASAERWLVLADRTGCP